MKFGGAANGVSFGRYQAGGNLEFVAQSSRTLGANNAGALVGPVVIHEIMYNPPSGIAGATEFIELRNITGAAVNLFDPAAPTHVWRLGNGIDFSFPPGATLAANGYLLVVDFNPSDAGALASFRSRYSVSGAVPVFGPYIGKLDNAGDSIELFKPDLPDGAFVPSVLVDSVSFGNSAPWPVGAVDGGGLTLQRRVATAYGNDASNWRSVAPTAGGANITGGIAPPVITQSPPSTNVLLNGNLFFQAAATGAGPISWQWRFNGAKLSGQTNSSLFFDYLRPDDSGVYDVYAVNAGGSAFSTPAQVIIAEPPFIISAPPGIYATNGGSNVTFNVVAGGTTPIGYQWKMNGANIPGAVTPTLAFTNLVIANSAVYSLAISNGYGIANANVTLLVLVRPVITNNPVSQTVVPGGTAIFTVVAGPNHPLVPLGYRWVRNNGILPPISTSEPVLVLTNVQSGYPVRVVVTNLHPLTAQSPSSGVNLIVTADSDSDGIPDWWEINYFGEINTTNNAANAVADPDGDGMINRDEYIAGTDPTNPLSLLNIVLMGTNANVLQFVAQTNVGYSVQIGTNLTSAAWNNVTNIIPSSALRTIEVNTATSPGGPVSVTIAW